jgi:hypothetical protein
MWPDPRYRLEWIKSLLDTPCRVCDRLWGDHTALEFREHQEQPKIVMATVECELWP